MHRVPTATIVGMLALTAGGCNWGESKTNNNNATIQPNIKPATSKAEQSASVRSQEPPLKLKSTPIAKSSDSTGLVGLTDSKQYVKQVQQGRPDPFASVFTVPPEIAAKPQLAVSEPVKPIAQELPPPPPPSITQPLPSPDLARGVAVQGVIETSSQLHAIVQLPDEATSRYVSVGQRLADGQLLVKKINITSDSDPVVILEQHGIEVAKAVGEEPAKLSDTKQATAAISASQPVASNSSEKEAASQLTASSQVPIVKLPSKPRSPSPLPSTAKLSPAQGLENKAQISPVSNEAPPSASSSQELPPESVAVISELTRSNSSSSAEFDERVGRSKQPIAQLGKRSSPNNSSGELDERGMRYQQLIARLEKRSASSRDSSEELDERGIRYQQLIARLEKRSASSDSSQLDIKAKQSRQELISQLRNR